MEKAIIIGIGNYLYTKNHVKSIYIYIIVCVCVSLYVCVCECICFRYIEGLYLIERLVLEPQLHVRTMQLIIDDSSPFSLNSSVIEALLSLRNQHTARRDETGFSQGRNNHRSDAVTHIVLAASREVSLIVLSQVCAYPV